MLAAISEWPNGSIDALSSPAVIGGALANFLVVQKPPNMIIDSEVVDVYRNEGYSSCGCYWTRCTDN